MISNVIFVLNPIPNYININASKLLRIILFWMTASFDFIWWFLMFLMMQHVCYDSTHQIVFIGRKSMFI